MTSTVIIVQETAWQSVLSDTYSLLSALGLVGIGARIGSDAMEWAGFLLFALTLVARAVVGSKARRTPQEAADFLRDEFGVIAKDMP